MPLSKDKYFSEMMTLLSVNQLFNFNTKKKKSVNYIEIGETNYKILSYSFYPDRNHSEVILNKRSNKLYLNSNLQYLFDAISITLLSIHIQQ